MTIQTFIEKAIEGGWKPDYELDESARAISGDVVLARKVVKGTADEFYSIEVRNEQVLLDPEAWKAVGKVEGWKVNHVEDMEGNYDECWKCHMHRMIDALAEGKTIEQFIETL